MLPLTFRSADFTDIGALTILINSAYRGDLSRLGWTTEADLLAGRRVDADGLAVLLADNDSLLLLAECNGNLLGTIHLQHSGEQVELGMFAVQPQQQSQGIGKQLLQAAEQLAITLWQARRATMSVIACRHELIAYYQRRGYQLTGKVKAFPVDSALWTAQVEDLVLVILDKTLHQACPPRNDGD